MICLMITQLKNELQKLQKTVSISQGVLFSVLLVCSLVFLPSSYSNAGGVDSNTITSGSSSSSTTGNPTSETVTNDDGSTTTTLDHTGFVSDKSKGDGYYSQPDGVHTVAYQIINLGDSTDDFNGTVKMQGTLATTPTEDDWFDVADTTFTADTSTVTSSANFTGNYVWVRSKVASVTAGTVNSILLNS